MRPPIDKKPRRRMLRLTVLIVLVWIILSGRLLALHFGPNDERRAEADKNHTKEQKILVGRGRILDTGGHIMAMDLALERVCVDPDAIRKFGNGDQVAAELSRILSTNRALIDARLAKSGRQYEVVGNNISVDTADAIAKANLKGVWFEDISRRFYPRGSLANHVLGFSDAEGIGEAGVERWWNKYLKGVPGLRISEYDGRQRELYKCRLVDLHPQAGNDVYLTIDQTLQFFLEEALDAGIATNNAKGGWAILERVKTGEILAMASRPCYDLNEFGRADTNQLLNRAIGYTYEPGSTFKMAIIAGALNDGIVKPDTMINCENGVWIYCGRPLRDFHPHGMLSVADVLKKSSNIGAAKIAVMCGPERVAGYVKAFCISDRAGIQVSGEEGGIHVAKWDPITLSRVAMGHSVSVTSLQILDILNAMANGGYMMKPQIVKKVVSTKGETLYSMEPALLGRPVRRDTAQLMCKLLARVTEDGGTAKAARFEGYTGTAEKVIPGAGYSKSANIASFCGMVPAEAPEIALIVVMDEPSEREHTGGAVCAPIFRQVMEKAVRYLTVPAVPEEKRWRFGNDIPKG